MHAATLSAPTQHVEDLCYLRRSRLTAHRRESSACALQRSAVTLARSVTRKSRRRDEWLERLCSKGHAHCGCGRRTRRASAPRESACKALVSGISHGTELSLYRGTSAFADRVFDRDLRAFVRPDPPRPVYPATLGYELVGTRRARSAPRCTSSRPATSSTSARRTARRRCSTSTRPAASTYPPVRLPTASRSSAGCSSASARSRSSPPTTRGSSSATTSR